MSPQANQEQKKSYGMASEFESIALLLQGGGALGSYQAGVYEALAEAGIQPDWIGGISIGAINGAIIAGNQPSRILGGNIGKSTLGFLQLPQPDDAALQRIRPPLPASDQRERFCNARRSRIL